MSEMNGVVCSSRPMRIGPDATKKVVGVGGGVGGGLQKAPYQSAQGSQGESDPNNRTVGTFFFMLGITSALSHIPPIYSRKVLSGEFVVVNKHLLHDLTEMGLWSPTLKNQIVYVSGSVQKIFEIPEHLRAIYKTVWEINQRTLLDMAVDRGCYIDQSQSLNIHMEQPNFGKLTSLHFHAWYKGLKTGMYYLRSRAAVDAIKFTVHIGSD